MRLPTLALFAVTAGLSLFPALPAETSKDVSAEYRISLNLIAADMERESSAVTAAEVTLSRWRIAMQSGTRSVGRLNLLVHYRGERLNTGIGRTAYSGLLRFAENPFAASAAAHIMRRGGISLTSYPFEAGYSSSRGAGVYLAAELPGEGMEFLLSVAGPSLLQEPGYQGNVLLQGPTGGGEGERFQFLASVNGREEGEAGQGYYLSGVYGRVTAVQGVRIGGACSIEKGGYGAGFMAVLALDRVHRGGAAVGCTAGAEIGRLSGEITQILLSEAYPASSLSGSAALSFRRRSAAELGLTDDLRINLTAEEEVNLDTFPAAVEVQAIRSFSSALNFRRGGYRLSISDTLTWTFTGRQLEQKRTARLSCSTGAGPLTGTLQVALRSDNRRSLDSEQSAVLRFSGELVSWTAELRRSQESHESRLSVEVRAGSALWRLTLSTLEPLRAAVVLRG
jgi:hypothetical protein